MIAHFYIFARKISIEIENASYDSCNANFIDEIVFLKKKTYVYNKKMHEGKYTNHAFFSTINNSGGEFSLFSTLT